MKKSFLALVSALFLFQPSGWSELRPEEYKKISQCVLVRERDSLVGKKVKLTGEFVGGSTFCYDLKKAKINTRDYICFAIGKNCMIRLYLHKNHPDAQLLSSLDKGEEVTAYGVFDYMGTDYNYIIVDGITAKGKEG